MTATSAVDYQALRGKSAPLLLYERARAEPAAVALRSKHLGLYRERTWHDYATMVARAARAFEALGLARGDRVAIMGDACEEWAVCDQAAQSLGAIVYGLYPTASASEVAYQMRDGGAALFIAENQEYVDKLMPIVDQLPDLRWIVVLDATAMFGYEHPKIRRYQDLLDAVPEPDLGGFRELVTTARSRSAGIYRVHVRHDRPSQGRAGHARQASGRNRQHRQPLSDARRQAAPGRCSTCRCAMCSAATWPSLCRCSRGSCLTSAKTPTISRRRSSRWRRPSCSPCRAICRNSPRNY